MILINTVGISMLGAWKDLGNAYNDQHRTSLINAIQQLPEKDPRLGAELTSIRSLMNQKVISPGDRLVFLVSDTQEGSFVGKVLAEIARRWGFQAESHVIKKLQGDDPKAFAQGLRNLVKEIATLYRDRPPSESMAINATGGYKAQISFAGLIGQVFGVPVYYQFESFVDAIELPPLPVSFAFDDWLIHRHILEALDEGEAGEFLRADDPRIKKSLPDRLRVLVEISQGLATLNALGALYHEGLRERFRAQADSLLPQASGLAPEAKKIHYEDGNAGRHRGLAEWLERIRAVPYVTRIQTFYYNPRLPGRSTVEPDPAHGDRVIAIYATHNATTKAYVYLSENDVRKAQAAAADLAERLR